MSYGMRRRLAFGFDDALARTSAALAGFGILTQIDVRDTLRGKLGVEFRPYRILGACNPPLAYRALQADLDVGLMLPCNVVVYEDDEGRSVVAAVDPTQMPAAHANPAIAAVGAEVRERLGRVLERVAESGEIRRSPMSAEDARRSTPTGV